MLTTPPLAAGDVARTRNWTSGTIHWANFVADFETSPRMKYEYALPFFVRLGDGREFIPRWRIAHITLTQRWFRSPAVKT
jgi:hypothetical protein